MLVRASSLDDSMSRYLIRRIEASPNISVHFRAEITALKGIDRLERVTWTTADGGVESRNVGGCS